MKSTKLRISALLARFIAKLRYGNALAVDPVWRAADRAERAARKDHVRSRDIHAAKTKRLHEGLEGYVRSHSQ